MYNKICFRITEKNLIKILIILKFPLFQDNNRTCNLLLLFSMVLISFIFYLTFLTKF